MLLTSSLATVTPITAQYVFTENEYSLWHAAKECDVEACRSLIAAGANVNANNIIKHLHTPLHAAASSGCTECARLLLEAGAIVAAENNHGYSALHLAARYGSTGVGELLLNANAHIEQFHTDSGITPLHAAAAFYHLEFVKMLLRFNASVDAQSPASGGTAVLHLVKHACQLESSPMTLQQRDDALAILDALHAAGADVNKVDKDMLSPLFIALSKKCVWITDKLLELGAIDTSNAEGLSCLMMAISHGKDDEPMIAALVKRSTDLSACSATTGAPLNRAIILNMTRTVQLLLEAGANINMQDECRHDRTPLYEAVSHQRRQLALALIESGARVDLMESERHFTPLHAAAEIGDAEVARALIRARANVNIQSKFGNTPLHVAIQSNHIDLCRELLAAGARTDIANHHGRDALQTGLEWKSTDIVRLLLTERSLPITCRLDSDGHAVVHTAVLSKIRDLAKLIVDASKTNKKKKKKTTTTTSGGTSDNSNNNNAADNNNNNNSDENDDKNNDNNKDNNNNNNKDGSDDTSSSSSSSSYSSFSSSGLECRTKDGQTALHLAAQSGSMDILEHVLLPNLPQSLVNAQDSSGQTPLHIASRYSRESMVRLLLDHDADITVEDRSGFTALHVLGLSNDGTFTHELLELLLGEAGDELSNRAAASAVLLEASRANNSALAQSLALVGVDGDRADRAGWRPLHFALQSCDVGLVMALLAANVDVNAQVRPSQQAPLHLAIRHCPDMIPALIQHGARASTAQFDGAQPLHVLAELGDVANMKILLDAGKADVHARTLDESTPLLLATCAGHLEAVRVLLDAGADANAGNLQQTSPLHCAAQFGHTDVAMLLIERKADVVAKTAESMFGLSGGNTPLDLAKTHAHEKIAKVLEPAVEAAQKKAFVDYLKQCGLAGKYYFKLKESQIDNLDKLKAMSEEELVKIGVQEQHARRLLDNFKHDEL